MRHSYIADTLCFTYRGLWPQPNVKDLADRALSAISFQRTAFGVMFVTSPRFAEKLQIKDLSACGD
jgi:hypothetical protein